jgi:hypothetical protein
MSREKQSLGRKIARMCFFVPLLLILSPVLLCCLIFYGMYRIALYLVIWLWSLWTGKDVLFVFSDSPIWHEYMTTEILPIVMKRAMVLNWSERKTWHEWSLPVRVFHNFSNGRDFNPMVLLFRPFRGVKSFRFFQAFKEWKHGDARAVEKLRDELVQAL